MSKIFNRPVYDTDCKPYKEQFSRKTQAEDMKNNASASPSKRKTTIASASAWLQSLSFTPYVAYGEDADVIARKSNLTEKEVKYYSTAEGVVDLNKSGIAMAVERRFALFFEQSMLCHKMPLEFLRGGEADEQYGSAPTLVLKTKDGKHSITHKRQAAHSSTLPKILAKTADGTIFNFLNGRAKKEHNQTIGMHEEVNHVDSWIDGTGGLRDRSITLLNDTAKGLTPTKASQLFLETFIEVNKENSRRLKGVQGFKAETKRLVSKAYIMHAREILEASKAPDFFDQLTGGLIEVSGDDEEQMRTMVLKKRYQLITLQETIEGRIDKRIQEAKKKVVGQEKFLEHALLKSFAEADDRKVLEKLLDKSVVPLETGYLLDGKVVDSKAYKSFLTSVNNFAEKNKAILSRLERDMRSDFRELSAAEFSYRSGLFWSMRKKVKNWTQKKFCELYEETTSKSISPSWVSRIEDLAHIKKRKPEDYKTPINQRRKYVTLTEAKDCAKVFGVSNGVFLPCLITSR